MRPSQTNTFFLNSVFLGNDRAQEISFSSPVLQTHGWMRRAEPAVATVGSGPRKQSPCTPFITEQGEAQEGKFQKKGDTWHTGSSYSPEKATYVDMSWALPLPSHMALDIVLPLGASVSSSTKWGNTHPADLSGGSDVTML